MTTIVAPPSNASKWQMGFNFAFKGLKVKVKEVPGIWEGAAVEAQLQSFET
jgi:hypothetical protein